MSRVLVAGGAGFLGSHLCEALLARGDDVVCVDDMSTGRESNMASFKSNPKFVSISGDAAHAATLDIHVRRKFDLIFNLASPASPPSYQAMQRKTLDCGSILVDSLLSIASEDKAIFVQASTSEVYGDPTVSPQTEEYRGNVSCVGPRSMYDEAKRFAEALCMAWHHEAGVDVRIARIFNTYGQRMDPQDGRVLPTLLRQAIAGEPMTIYGNGLQTRSFCYVDDLVRGLIALADAPSEKVTARPINLGNPHEITIIEFAHAVAKACGVVMSRVHSKAAADDPQCRCPDITRARALLGWEPKVSLADGLSRTVAWYKEHHLEGK